ncbi:MAG: ATP-binding cassette domain-containing protein [Acidobacteria bacterium]|nr:ATP-binding cassette domain-containing protein [Acidobacteriota bacterium]
MVVLSHVHEQYGRQALFIDAPCQRNPGEAVGLVGPNGSGMTTLFRLTTGEEVPDDGEIGSPRRSTGTSAATPSRRRRARSCTVPVSTSGPTATSDTGRAAGRCAVMARALIGRPDARLIDGPTNHLAPATKEVLRDGLGAFGGAMTFVSHDRAFLRRLGSRAIELGRESGTGARRHLCPGSYTEDARPTGRVAPGVHA